MLATLEAQVPVMLFFWSVSLTQCMAGPEVFLTHHPPDLCSEGIGQEEDALQTSLPVFWRKSVSGRWKGKAEVYSEDLAPPQRGL